MSRVVYSNRCFPANGRTWAFILPFADWIARLGRSLALPCSGKNLLSILGNSLILGVRGLTK